MAAGVDPTAQAASAATHLVLEALPHAVVVTDNGGRIVGWNAESQRLFGWTAEEVTGRHVDDVIVQAGPVDTSHGVLATTQKGEVWRGDVSIVRRDGDIVRISTAVAPMRDGDGTIIGAVGASDDVTERRMAEQYATDMAEHFRLALEAGQLGTWRWDLATGVVTWDPAMERLYGLAPGTFAGTYEAWLELRGQASGGADAARETLERALVTREPYKVENRVVWPDGTVHWLEGRGRATVDERGEVTGAIGCTADVTAHKAAGLEAERRAREVAEAARRERLTHERLAFLARISDAALSAADHLGFMATVTGDAVPLLGDWCMLHFIPEAGAVPEVAVAHADPTRVEWIEQLRAGYTYNPSAATGAAAVMRTGTTEFVEVVDDAYVAALATAASDRREAEAIIELLQLTSIITVPLLTKRGVLGAMQFVSAESGRRYRDDDRTLAEAAAGRIAEALDNMWLTQQQRHIAATLQSALLPPRLPALAGMGVAVRYWAAGAAIDVGGDFYDLFAIGEDRWAVVIGDVCGTGPDAAAVTSITRHTIRAAAVHGVDHVAVLDWLNGAVIAGRRDRFCTALYATLEPHRAGGPSGRGSGEVGPSGRGSGEVGPSGRGSANSWTMTVVSGGHPLPVVVRANGAVETVGTPGTLIGVFPVVRAAPGTTHLHPGDTVVLYTDGVTDQRPPYGLGRDEVEALVRRAVVGSATADETAAAIGTAIETNRPIPDRGDDIALVVLRVD